MADSSYLLSKARSGTVAVLCSLRKFLRLTTSLCVVRTGHILHYKLLGQPSKIITSRENENEIESWK